MATQHPAIHDFLSVEEQKLLMQLLPDDVVLVTPDDQRIVYCNHSAISPAYSALIGRHYCEIATEKGYGVLQEALERAIEDKAVVVQEAELNLAGTVIWALVRMLPVVREGKLKYVLMTHTNITALKNAINDLEFSQKRLKDHLDHTPLAAMMWDTHGITLEWNPASEQIFGYSREEAMGKHFTDLIVPHGTIEMHKRQYAETVRTGELDINPRAENITKDGKVIQCQWFSTILRNSQGEIVGVAGLAQDITLKIQIEKDREAAKLAAEASANAKAQFLANMSHEIRTPLNGIIGMIELLKLEALDLDQQQKLNIIHQSSQTLLAILNDVLDFSKIESDAVKIEKIDVDVNRLINQIVGLMRPASEKKCLSLEWQALPDNARYICGDPNRLTQILSNLISNAIKFTETGGIKIQTRHQLLNDNRIRIMIDVVDTGIGIQEDDLQHIFDDFSQADASITRRYGGTGLGLTICKRLAQLMDGEISVQSAYQKGSRFTFQWDADMGSPQNTVEKFDAIVLPQQYTGTVLLVDDNDVNLLVGTHMLQSLGLKVQSAKNGSEAISAVAQNPLISLVLMDVHMPEMNGLDAAMAIRQLEHNAKVPIIAVTANVLESEWQQCLAAGMNDWLAKPFTLNMLSQKLINWLH